MREAARGRSGGDLVEGGGGVFVAEGADRGGKVKPRGEEAGHRHLQGVGLSRTREIDQRRDDLEFRTPIRSEVEHAAGLAREPLEDMHASMLKSNRPCRTTSPPPPPTPRAR
jgi:hypothetical protein